MKTEETQIEGLKKEKGVVFFFFWREKGVVLWGEKNFVKLRDTKTVTFEEVNSTSRIRPHSRDQLGFMRSYDHICNRIYSSCGRIASIWKKSRVLENQRQTKKPERNGINIQPKKKKETLFHIHILVLLSKIL